MKAGLKRIAAVLALTCILICLAGLMINAFFGSDQRITLIFLFFLIVVPAVAFIFIKFIETQAGHGGPRDSEK